MRHSFLLHKIPGGNIMNKGLLFVLTGASSVGKKDIRDRLLGDEQLHLNYSISMTTRPKRG